MGETHANTRRCTIFGAQFALVSTLARGGRETHDVGARTHDYGTRMHVRVINVFDRREPTL